MRFDRTQGKSAKYIVSIYGENIEDKYYYHNYKDATNFFDSLLNDVWEVGTILSIYDMQKDIRKRFIKF